MRLRPSQRFAGRVLLVSALCFQPATLRATFQSRNRLLRQISVNPDRRFSNYQLIKCYSVTRDVFRVNSSSQSDIPAINRHMAGKFSIRDMMLLVFAIAAGLALGRLPQFQFIDACFASASILVIFRLLMEVSVSRCLGRPKKRRKMNKKEMMLSRAISLIAVSPTCVG